MAKPDAQQLFARLALAPHLFGQAWAAADMDGDGVLARREFCLFMALLRLAQKGAPLPARLTAAQAAALLGQEQQAQGGSVALAAEQQQQQQPPPIKVDLQRIRSALHHTGRRQQSLDAAEGGAAQQLLQHGEQVGSVQVRCWRQGLASKAYWC